MGYLQRAHHASFVMNADVVTSSAGPFYCNRPFNTIHQAIIRDILDNGTVIVMPAGNGWNGTHCAENGVLAPVFPLHPRYDDRIIIVSSTDRNDYHTFINPDNGIDGTHSHFSYVDITAPGFGMLGAWSTLNHDGTPSESPYTRRATGTSFATPIVAGVVALIRSINPNLTPREVKDIIKATADPIADAHLFPGLVGAGRVNAYRAVRAVCEITAPTINLINQPPITADKTIISCGTINVQNVTVTNNARLELQAVDRISISGGFSIQPGASFRIR